MSTNLAHNHVLFIDVETTGLAIGVMDPTLNPETGARYQPISIGALVVDISSMTVVDKLYVEIQFDGSKYVWSPEAERVHGLSRQYLATAGIPIEQAAVQLAKLIVKWWGTDKAVSLGGHNVATFDRWFIYHLLDDVGIAVKWANKTYDSNSVGFAVFNAHSSDQLFKIIGVTRDKHNALEDAHASFLVFKKARKLIENLAK